tara:strand:- start:1826 stop:3520 length:1695 start_codon:yes stop_codon:yes gene_type:complete
MPIKQEDKYYLGNRNLPAANMEFEWTPKMVRELKKTRQNLLYFAENFFFIVNLDKGKMKIPLYASQKRVLRSLRDNRFVACLASRQTGKTTMMTIYSLWVACFQEDQRILVVANKEQTAINIFSRIRTAYEMLPNYLKPGVIEYGKTSMKLANGSSIGISTTSSDAGRGDACNVLVLDELAFIPNNLVDAFWKSVYPIISSSKKSKIFIASTPNGTDNLFYKLYMDGLNKKSNWYAEKMMWHEIPGRDEEWKRETIQSIGSEEAFRQEFDCEFIESGDTFIDEEYFFKLESGIQDPKHIFEDGAYKVWEEPDINSIYTIGVDVAEGVGKNSSVIQILDITDLTNIKQVAEYCSNTINPYEFATKVHDICEHWGSPPVLIERNNSGAQVVDLLYQNYRYPNIVSYSPRTGKFKFDRMGVYAHTNTKYKGVMNMRYWVHELKCIIFRSKETIQELKAFQRKPNGTWCAKPGYDDDRVMSLIWSLMILDSALVQRYYDVIELDDNGKPKNIILSEFVHQNFKGFLNDYKTENASDTWEPPNVVFQDINNSEGPSEMDDLVAQGWEVL